MGGEVTKRGYTSLQRRMSQRTNRCQSVPFQPALRMYCALSLAPPPPPPPAEPIETSPWTTALTFVSSSWVVIALAAARRTGAPMKLGKSRRSS